MFEPIGAVKGGAGAHGALAMFAAIRDGQASLRSLQKANGHAGPAGDNAQTKRPVTGNAAADTPRAALLNVAVEGVYGDPNITGPKPTFAKTPLEKMRSDAFVIPQGAEPDPTNAPTQETVENPPEDETQMPQGETNTADELRPTAPYCELHRFEGRAPAPPSLDIKT